MRLDLSSDGEGAIQAVAVSPATGGGDDEHIAHRHLRLPDRPEDFLPPAVPLDVILSGRARAAAGHAEGARLAAIAQDGGRHRGEEAYPSHAALAAAPPAGTAGTFANFEGLHAHRELGLKYVGVHETEIGHVDLDHTRTGETGPRAGTACNRFIVLVAGIAESEVIHGALAPGPGGPRPPQGS